MDPLAHDRWGRRLRGACVVVLLGASVTGWLMRHRVAYDLQIRRGNFVERSIPRWKTAAWLKETLRTDPSPGRRMRAANLLPYYADEWHVNERYAEMARELLAALGDPDLAVQEVAWESLIRPAGIMVMCGYRPLLRAAPTRDLLAALMATNCKAARQELLWEIAERDQEEGVRAACHILSHKTDRLSTENVMYWIGDPLGDRGLMPGGLLPRVDARRVAHSGLDNPDSALRLRCARFLIMLGGDDLSQADRAWIDLLRRDDDLRLDAMGSFGKHFEYRPVCIHGQEQLDETTLDILRGFIAGLSRRFGSAVALPFARAGADSWDPDVARVCNDWLEGQQGDIDDASSR